MNEKQNNLSAIRCVGRIKFYDARVNHFGFITDVITSSGKSLRDVRISQTQIKCDPRRLHDNIRVVFTLRDKAEGGAAEVDLESSAEWDERLDFLRHAPIGGQIEVMADAMDQEVEVAPDSRDRVGAHILSARFKSIKRLRLLRWLDAPFGEIASYVEAFDWEARKEVLQAFPEYLSAVIDTWSFCSEQIDRELILMLSDEQRRVLLKKYLTLMQARERISLSLVFELGEEVFIDTAEVVFQYGIVDSKADSEGLIQAAERLGEGIDEHMWDNIANRIGFAAHYQIDTWISLTRLFPERMIRSYRLSGVKAKYSFHYKMLEASPEWLNIAREQTHLMAPQNVGAAIYLISTLDIKPCICKELLNIALSRSPTLDNVVTAFENGFQIGDSFLRTVQLDMPNVSNRLPAIENFPVRQRKVIAERIESDWRARRIGKASLSTSIAFALVAADHNWISLNHTEKEASILKIVTSAAWEGNKVGLFHSSVKLGMGEVAAGCLSSLGQSEVKKVIQLVIEDDLVRCKLLLWSGSKSQNQKVWQALLVLGSNTSKKRHWDVLRENLPSLGDEFEWYVAAKYAESKSRGYNWDVENIPQMHSLAAQISSALFTDNGGTLATLKNFTISQLRGHLSSVESHDDLLRVLAINHTMPTCEGRFTLGERQVDKPCLLCEGRFWKTLEEVDLYWCRGDVCTLPSRHEEKSQFYEWTLLEMARSAGLSISDLEWAQYAGYLNRLSEIAPRLKCATCDQLLSPMPKDHDILGYYALPLFCCENTSCREKGTVIRITHCMNCHRILDDRERPQCESLWLVCDECMACCKDHHERHIGSCPSCGRTMPKVLDKQSRCGNCGHRPSTMVLKQFLRFQKHDFNYFEKRVERLKISPKSRSLLNEEAS